jgi:thioredoxin 1
MALEITDSNFHELLNSSIPLVVDFGAEWCPPCVARKPFIDELSKQYEGKIHIGKFDVDQNPKVSVEYGVRNLPTLLFFKDGKVVDKQVGAIPKNTLIKKIEEKLS